MSEPAKSLGSTEIEVLRYLGDHPASSVAEVAEHFAQTSGQARTTILTIMERLRKKGHVTRRQAKGVYRYTARASQQDLLRGLVRQFIDTTLAGSWSPFVAYLAESEPLTDDELQKLKQAVRELERKRKENGA